MEHIRFAGQLRVVLALVLTLSLAADEPSLPARDPQRPPSEGGAPGRTDRYGDPLPAGALARLGTVRFRHGNGATVAFAADGKSLLTFGGDRTVRHWDIDSGRQLREQQLPRGPFVPTSCLSPDGRLLAFQDWDTLGFVSVWDVARNELRHKLPLPERWLSRAAFSRDSKTLVTVEGGGVLRAWDVATGKGRLVGQHKWGLFRLSFTADGRLMTSDADNIRFWDLAGGREPTRATIPGSAFAAVVSPDGRTVAALSFHNGEPDRGVQFLDAVTGAPAEGWHAPDVKRVHDVLFTPDGKTLLVALHDRVLVWDPIGGKLLRTLRGGQGRNLVLSPDGKTVAAFGTGNADDPRGAVVYVWDLATGRPRAATTAEHGHLGEVGGVAIAPDGRTVASSCPADNTLRLWEAATGRLLRTLPVEELQARTLAFSPDGKQVFAGTSPALIRWDVATGREVTRYPLSEGGKEDRYHLLAMHLTADGRKLIALSQNLGVKERARGLHAWDVATGKRQPTRLLAADDTWIAYSSFSSDGRLIALPGGSVRDAATGQELLRLPTDGKQMDRPVAISQDGALLATGVWRPFNRPPVMGSEMVAVQVWELATLQPVRRLETGPAAHLALTPDGRRLIVAGPEALQLWDLASGRVVASRPAPGRFRGSYGESFASALGLAADGRTVATGHADTTVVLWDLAPPRADRPSPPLAEPDLDSCWADLAGADAGKAAAALARLADVPGQATALLRDRLRAARAVPAEELRRLIADLDADEFARREAAMSRLTELGELAEAALREALRGRPSPEVRRRVEALLSEPRTIRSPEARRHLRAVRLLEAVGTPGAREVLKKLTEGVSEARLTQEARAALDRLAR
jgi:WD40 repeat protein